MASKRPATVDEYIRAAPPDGQAHLRRIDAILKSVAPKADRIIKWGTPFFVEPRFLFAFSATKRHVNFAPMAAALTPFKKELARFKTTKNFLQIPYDEPLPEALIRKIAKRCVLAVRESGKESFW